MNYPRMATVEQRLCEQDVGPIGPAVAHALSALDMEGRTRPGDSVAVAVGSRGIAELPSIVEGVIHHLHRHALKPFIVPAMGSHGGGTAEGEREVLARLGITEARVGAPIKAGPEVVEIGTLAAGPPVLMGREAVSADHIVVVNRVKPHTKFRAPIESGLTKMLTVGLGKSRGAALYHRAAVDHGFAILEDAAALILKHRPVLFGLAVLEDGRRRVAKLAAVTPENWFETERALLREARAMLPGIPFDALDVLIIDEIGKHISGIGMDSNVTGRHRDIVGDFFVAPHAKRIFVRGMSPDSDGNATGIGLADVTTTRLIEAVNLEKTYTNAVAALSLEKAALPMHFSTDRECLDVCLKTIGMVPAEKARIVRIKNTLRLDRFEISEALEPEMSTIAGLRRLSAWEALHFDSSGNLPSLEI